MNLDERKSVVNDFLARCVEYSDASLKRKVERGESADEIVRWQAYREFTAYAISEIESGELDDWFGDEYSSTETTRPQVGDGFSEQPPSPELLGALVSPRPVALLSTRSTEGIDNLCAVTSHSVLANHPPLIGVSLSVSEEGRERDSLVNLRANSQASLIVLPANWDSVQIVEAAATDLPHTQSEWDLLEDSPQSVGAAAFHPNAVAVIECSTEQLHPLPAGSVATLAILRVERVLLPNSIDSNNLDLAELGPLLSQHGLLRLTAGPDTNQWSHQIKRD